MSHEFAQNPQLAETAARQAVQAAKDNGFFGQDGAARDQLRQYAQNHDGRLTEVAASLGREAKKAGVALESFDAEHTASFASKPDGTFGVLDLEALGLPALSADVAANNTPLALTVNAEKSTGRVGGMTLLLRGPHGLNKLYLEDIPAAVDSKVKGQPKWAVPGETMLSRADNTEAALTGRGKKSMLTLRTTAQEGSYIVRPKASALEAKASASAKERSTKKRRGAKTLGVAAMAGIAIAALPLHGTTPHKNAEITTAQDEVRPAGTTEAAGISQAEQFFDAATLDRSRQAFEAYFSGDTAALQAQQAEQGYQMNWIDANKVTAISDARNNSELEAAFNAAFEGLPVTLSVAGSQDSIKAIEDGYEKLTPAGSLASSKKLALAAVHTFNTFDKSQLQKNMKPLQYFVVGSIKDTSHDSAGREEGYYAQATDASKPDQIVIADNGASDAKETLPHELTHYFDANSGGKLTAYITQLDAPNHSYVGYDKYPGTPTTVKGEKNTATNYGNAEPIEDTAEDGAREFTQNPTLDFQNSPYNEKTTAIMFAMEKQYPGFTAAFLSRNKPDRPSEFNKISGRVLYEVGKLDIPIYGVAGLTLTMLAGARLRDISQRRSLARRGSTPTSF